MNTLRNTSVGISTVIVAAASVMMLGSLAPATASESPSGAPEVVAPSADAPVGSMMPNFGQDELTSQAAQYSVTIDSVPTSSQIGQQITVSGHTTGFAPGNWVNVWIRMPDGSQMDDGGTIAADGSFTLPATLAYAGVNSVQVSAGAWPNEQWSAPVNVTVGADGTSTAARGVVYHDLAGQAVVVAGAGQLSGFRGATFSLCPARGGMCVHQVATPAAYNAYVGVYPVPVGGFLQNAAPNSGDFMKAITFQNL